VLAVALPGRLAAQAGVGCLLAGLAVALAGRRV
jgi:hypothetical protein